MMTAVQGDQRLLHRFRATSQAASSIAVGVGFLVLLGWGFNIDLFKSISPQWVAMQPNTAIGFILTGLALKLVHTPRPLQKRLARSLAFVVIMLGGLTLTEHLFNWNLGIDNLLFPTITLGRQRMPPVTALNFMLIGLSLWGFTGRRVPHRLTQLLAFLAGLASLQIFISYFYGVPPSFGLVHFNHAATHTSLTFLVLALGVCFVAPRHGWMKVVTSNTAGGMTARVLLPAAIAIPLGLGWLRVMGVRLGLLSNEVGMSLHVLGNIVGFIGLVWYCSQRLYRIDLRRGRAEAALQAAYDELEIRVQRRTAELSQANQSLEQEIGERRRAEAALGESQEQLQAFVDNTPAIIYMKDLQGRFLLVNRQFETLFGVSREAVIGKTDYDIFPENLAEVFQANDRRIIETGEAIEFEEAAPQADGLHTYISVKFLLYDGGHAPFAIGGISADISDRKRAEEAVRASEAKLRAIVDNATALIYLKDVEGRHLLVNQQFEVLFGKSQEQVLGKRDTEVYSPEQAATFRENDLQVMAAGKPIKYEEDILIGNELRNYLSVKFPLHDADQALYGIGGISMDTTELRQIEAALRRSEERFRQAVLGSPLPIMLHAEDGEILEINHAWVNISGYQPEEVPTIAIWTAKAYGPRQAEVQAAIAQLFSSKHQVAGGERAITTRTGETRIWDFYSAPLGQMPDGRRLVITTAIDITDRKQAEEERDQFFRLSIDMLCIAGMDGYFKQLNPAWERTLGYSRKELMAQPFINFVHPLDRERTLLEAARHEINNPSFTFENRYRCKDGSYKWLEWSSVASPERDVMYAAARDISMRKQTEQQLAYQAEVLQRQADLLELTYEAIIVRDEEGRITYWNRGAELMYGWPRDEAMGQVTHTFLHTQPPIPGLDLDQTVRQEEHWQGELVHTCRDGQQIVVESRQVMIRDDYNKPTGFLEVNRDITERKLAEDNIRQLNASLEQRVQERTAQLVEINQELKYFTYSVSHDLRSPLRAIRGLIDALVEDYWTCLDEIGQEYAQHIANSAARMDTLIQDLLTYSRLSQTEVQLQRVELPPLMQEILAQLEPEQQAKQAEITVDLPMPSVLAQPTILTQVLINLLNNALKYVAPDVQPQVRVWAEQRQDRVRLWVADNGIGIDPDYHNRIFGVFERLHSADFYGGTGVGLAIVQRGIERMRGQVGVESHLGQGSRFWIELPAWTGNTD